MKEDEYSKIDKELLEYVEDVLLNRCEDATERMLEYAATLEPKCKPTAVRKTGVRHAWPQANPQGQPHSCWLQPPGPTQLICPQCRSTQPQADPLQRLCSV